MQTISCFQCGDKPQQCIHSVWEPTQAYNGLSIQGVTTFINPWMAFTTTMAEWKMKWSRWWVGWNNPHLWGVNAGQRESPARPPPGHIFWCRCHNLWIPDERFRDNICAPIQWSGSWQFPYKGFDIHLGSCVHGVALWTITQFPLPCTACGGDYFKLDVGWTDNCAGPLWCYLRCQEY